MGFGLGSVTKQTGGTRDWNRAFLRRQGLGTENGVKKTQGAPGK